MAYSGIKHAHPSYFSVISLQVFLPGFVGVTSSFSSGFKRRQFLEQQDGEAFLSLNPGPAPKPLELQTLGLYTPGLFGLGLQSHMGVSENEGYYLGYYIRVPYFRKIPYWHCGAYTYD